MPLYRDLLDLVDQRVLVMEPTLAAVRDTLRLLALPGGAEQPQRAVVVLNRVGMPGGLTRTQVEDALKMKVDVAIPDLPRQVGNAATLGEPAMAQSSGFRAGVIELARQVAFVGLLDSASGSGRRAPFRAAAVALEPVPAQAMSTGPSASAAACRRAAGRRCGRVRAAGPKPSRRRRRSAFVPVTQRAGRSDHRAAQHLPGAAGSRPRSPPCRPTG